VGQKLKLSGSGGGTSSAPSSSHTTTHVVRKGESLGSIASRYGVSTAQLQKDNGIRDASHIVVGQKLTVRGGSGGGTSSASKASSTTYTVQRGDSLGKIATKYGCSVNDIKAWNNLKTTTIQPGQKLVIKK
jgi:LysM repeat protein